MSILNVAIVAINLAILVAINSRAAELKRGWSTECGLERVVRPTVDADVVLMKLRGY